jgi:kinesin family member 22
MAEEEAKRAAAKGKTREPMQQESIPSGTLTPLLRQKEDVDGGELKKRLEELEQKL